jgi:PAS domain S-box-containing protein
MLHHFSKPKIFGAWGLILLLGGLVGWWGWRNEQAKMIADLMDDAKWCAVAFSADELRALAGTRADLSLPAYAEVKRRLIALREVTSRVRFVYIFRIAPEPGKVTYLGDSAKPGAKDESLPGDDYPQAAEAPGLQRIIANGEPATEGPLSDDFGKWVTGYAAIASSPSAKANALTREILGLDIDAADWEWALWSAAFQRAFFVWMILGLPFFALLAFRRQLEQREAIRNLSEAMEQSHSALMIVDLESCIEYANRGLCNQIGYSRRELIGRKWRDFQVAETPPEMLAELVSTVRSGKSWEGEWFNRRKDGVTYPVHGVITPVKGRDGGVSCFVAVFDDMTEIKRKEAELREARDLARAGDRAKGQFLATMSHEVRTPLNGLVGFTNLLLDTSLSTEQRDYVQTIRSSGEALIQLTGDILDYARIESGKLALEPAPCDPRECVEEALDLFAAAASAKGLELLHWVDDGVPASVLADGGRLRQVLVNLVNNAVKFTETGSVSVTVGLAGAPSAAASPMPPAESVAMAPAMCDLLFAVHDTGVGIAVDQHAKLFKPFSQIDSSSTRKFGGTGLGLAICRNLAHLMAGEITFTSKPGRGSVFSFIVRLPVVEPPRSAPELAGLRLAVVAKPGVLRGELARLAVRWHAQLTEADTVAALKGALWDTALVEVDEGYARSLATSGAVAPGLPVARTFGLVPISLGSEHRAMLRAHFRLLINKPVHHDALYALLRGLHTAPPLPSRPPIHFDLHVLVVEDNPVNQRLIQKVLGNLGCRWTIAENGRRAVEALATATTEFNLVLMDLHMPELDGLGAIREIREGKAGLRAQTIWIAALTADARDDQRQRAFEVGANDYLTKPLRLPELEASMRRSREARGGNR